MRCFVERESVDTRHHTKHPAFFDGVRIGIYPCLKRSPPVGTHFVVEHTKIAGAGYERGVGGCPHILLEGFERLSGTLALISTRCELLDEVNA